MGFSLTLGEGGSDFFFFLVGAVGGCIKAFMKPELSITTAMKAMHILCGSHVRRSIVDVYNTTSDILFCFALFL